MRLAYLSFVVFAAWAVFTGCTQQGQTAAPSSLVYPEGAHLTQAQVVSIATRAAEQQGVHLANYKEPEAHYQFTRKDGTWSVFFYGKTPMPGNHFLVWVDDQTQQTKFVWGE